MYALCAITISITFLSIPYIQNAFVEIIKQMTPIDAHNIRDILNAKTLPICQLQQKSNVNEEGYNIIYDLLYWLPSKNEEDWQQNSISLVNLQRLGLIQYGFDTYLIDDIQYKHYDNSNLIKALKNNNQNIELKKGVVEITPYGRQFKIACL
ncbi:MAG: DUF4393 domain-containing protein [Treponema sp.]|nr:DUF4393 domain-containing protein [Treponema sp.]